jgi:hypothetical protein
LVSLRKTSRYNKKQESIMETYEAAIGDSIKVHITSPPSEDGFGGESVWAEELGNNTARINNIPFFIPVVGFDDIVRYEIEDGIREFKEVVTKVTDTWGVTWEPTDNEDKDGTTEEWHKIAAHLKSNDVHYESAIAGMFVIALPVDTAEEENIIWLKALKYSCPIDLTLYLDRDDEDED